MKHTKIVATIGPSSEKKEVMDKMVKAGMNVARLNFSHGSHKNHLSLIHNIRSVAKANKTRLAIIQDLQGPRIRIGEVKKEGIAINAGETIILAAENLMGKKKLTGKIVPIQYHDLYRDLKKNHRILIEDATIELAVDEIKNKLIYAKVVTAGVIKTHKGMNFPDSVITCPPVTEKDMSDVEFGVKNGVDFVAMSFVENADDIIRLKKRISQLEKRFGNVIANKKVKNFKFASNMEGGPIGVIAKIERREAVNNIDKIIEATDGIMVARGDLGIEMPFEELPLIQKMIIEKCRQAGKPVIVATQMLDSMIRNPLPTRAEVSDVANAVLDGADAVMLSGESASGKYPVKAVQAMAKIAKEMEGQLIAEQEAKEGNFKNNGSVSQAISFIAQDIAEDVSETKIIVCATMSGFTANNISRFRPGLPIVAITPSKRTMNQLALSWGVESFYLPFVPSFETLLKKINKLLLEKKLAKKRDKAVVVAGHPFEYNGESNLIEVESL